MASPDKTPIRVLLAEDDSTNQYVFETILSSGGFEVEVVENGQLALDAAHRARPSIFLLDMMMPVMDGYETAFHLANEPKFDGIPILALTARAMSGDKEKTLEAGCDGYLTKPIGRQELISAVDDWISRATEDWMPARLEKRHKFGRSA